jgi:hypothetical protein
MEMKTLFMFLLVAVTVVHSNVLMTSDQLEEDQLSSQVEAASNTDVQQNTACSMCRPFAGDCSCTDLVKAKFEMDNFYNEMKKLALEVHQLLKTATENLPQAEPQSSADQSQPRQSDDATADSAQTPQEKQPETAPVPPAQQSETPAEIIPITAEQPKQETPVEPKLSSAEQPKLDAPVVTKPSSSEQPKVQAPVEPKLSSAEQPKLDAPVLTKPSSSEQPKVQAPVEPKLSSAEQPKLDAPVVTKPSSAEQPKVDAPVEPKLSSAEQPKLDAPVLTKTSSSEQPKVDAAAAPTPRMNQNDLIQLSVLDDDLEDDEVVVYGTQPTVESREEVLQRYARMHRELGNVDELRRIGVKKYLDDEIEIKVSEPYDAGDPFYNLFPDVKVEYDICPGYHGMNDVIEESIDYLAEGDATPSEMEILEVALPYYAATYAHVRNVKADVVNHPEKLDDCDEIQNLISSEDWLMPKPLAKYFSTLEQVEKGCRFEPKAHPPIATSSGVFFTEIEDIAATAAYTQQPCLGLIIAKMRADANDQPLVFPSTHGEKIINTEANLPGIRVKKSKCSRLKAQIDENPAGLGHPILYRLIGTVRRVLYSIFSRRKEGFRDQQVFYMRRLVLNSLLKIVPAILMLDEKQRPRAIAYPKHLQFYPKYVIKYRFLEIRPSYEIVVGEPFESQAYKRLDRGNNNIAYLNAQTASQIHPSYLDELSANTRSSFKF